MKCDDCDCEMSPVGYDGWFLCPECWWTCFKEEEEHGEVSQANDEETL